MLGFLIGNWQRFLAYGAIAILAAGMLELDGYRRGERKLWEYQADEAKAAVVVVVKQGKVTQQIVYRYVHVREAAQVVEKVIEKEVVRYAETNPGGCLDARWRSLHDAAASGVSDAGRGADDAGGAPAADAALDRPDGSCSPQYRHRELRSLQAHG